MKKNENGYPSYKTDETPVLNMNGSATNDGVRIEGNKTSSDSRLEGRIRPREGCSESGTSEAQEGREADEKCDEVPLAYVYAPVQKFCMLYSNSEALKHGTLFENLYKPLGVYGVE